METSSSGSLTFWLTVRTLSKHRLTKRPLFYIIGFPWFNRFGWTLGANHALGSNAIIPIGLLKSCVWNKRTNGSQWGSIYSRGLSIIHRVCQTIPNVEVANKPPRCEITERFNPKNDRKMKCSGWKSGLIDRCTEPNVFYLSHSGLLWIWSNNQLYIYKPNKRKREYLNG